jgi:hypothetical protein
MNMRRTLGILRVWAALSVFALLLCGCAAGVVANIVSVGTFGKSITDHVLDTATGKDCNLFQRASRADRDVCESRESDGTKHDFKGLAGIFKGLSDKSPTNNKTVAQEVHSQVETAHWHAENARPQLEPNGKPISLEPNGKPIPSVIFRAPVGAQ